MNERTTYLGPFFLCFWDVIEAKKPVPICGNADCKSHGQDIKSDFCPNCGRVRSERFIPDMKQSAYAHWIMNDLNDAIFGQDVEKTTDSKIGQAWFIPNVRREGSSLEYDADLDFLTPVRIVRAETIKQGTAWLRKAFAEEYKHLKKAYSSVQVVWGQLSYYH